jgi:hypothetical protein
LQNNRIMKTTQTPETDCRCCQSKSCDLIEQEIQNFTEQNIKNLALIGWDYLKTQKGYRPGSQNLQLSEADIEYFKQALLVKYGKDISSRADEMVAKNHPSLKPGSSEYAAFKKHKIASIINNAFQRFSKPAANWASDQSYFFNRRTEQGFKSNQNTAEKLSGLFGDLLYDIVYPKWWGGQKGSWIYDQTYSDGVTTKVNNQPAGVATVGNAYSSSVVPSWHQHYPPGSENKNTQQSTPEAARPKSTTQDRKVNPASLIPAGVQTLGKPSQFTVDSFNRPIHNYEGQQPILHHSVHQPENIQKILNASHTGRFEAGSQVYSPFLQPSDYYKVHLSQLYPVNQQARQPSVSVAAERTSGDFYSTGAKRTSENELRSSNPYLRAGADKGRQSDELQYGKLIRQQNPDEFLPVHYGDDQYAPKQSDSNEGIPNEMPLLPPAVATNYAEHAENDQNHDNKIHRRPQQNMVRVADVKNLSSRSHVTKPGHLEAIPEENNLVVIQDQAQLSPDQTESMSSPNITNPNTSHKKATRTEKESLMASQRSRQSNNQNGR